MSIYIYLHAVQRQQNLEPELSIFQHDTKHLLDLIKSKCELNNWDENLNNFRPNSHPSL